MEKMKGAGVAVEGGGGRLTGEAEAEAELQQSLNRAEEAVGLNKPLLR